MAAAIAAAHMVVHHLGIAVVFPAVIKEARHQAIATPVVRLRMVTVTLTVVAAAIPMDIAVQAVAVTRMATAILTVVAAVIRMVIVTLVTVPHHMAIHPGQTHLHPIIAM